MTTPQEIDKLLDLLQVKPAPYNADKYIQSLSVLLESVRDVPGDIVELGTYRGQNAIIFGKLIKELTPDKRYCGFDSFSGYAAIDIETSNCRDMTKKAQDSGRWNYSVEEFQNSLAAASVSDVCSVVHGDIKVTFPERLFSESYPNKISLLYIDCNAFLPAYLGMKFGMHFMDKGSIICIDEHTKGGETLALETLAKEYNLAIAHTGKKYPEGPAMYLAL